MTLYLKSPESTPSVAAVAHPYGDGLTVDDDMRALARLIQDPEGDASVEALMEHCALENSAALASLEASLAPPTTGPSSGVPENMSE